MAETAETQPGAYLPGKQSLGLLLLSLGFFIIAIQVKSLGPNEKLGVSWLILMYLFHTLGELCLSPIGLSLVSKLAPHRFSSLLMGVWFLANAAGYALAGTLGALLPPTYDKFELATKNGINLQGILDGTITATAAQLDKLHELKLAAHYPTFAGFTSTTSMNSSCICDPARCCCRIIIYLYQLPEKMDAWSEIKELRIRIANYGSQRGIR